MNIGDIILKLHSSVYIIYLLFEVIFIVIYNNYLNRFSRRRKGNVLFNDALNTFYLRLYGVIHMVKDYSDSERGNPLSPHGLLFSISITGSFICIIPQTG